MLISQSLCLIEILFFLKNNVNEIIVDLHETSELSAMKMFWNRVSYPLINYQFFNFHVVLISVRSDLIEFV